MANLLPESDVQQLGRDRVLRLAAMVLFVCAIAGVVSAMLLSVAYVVAGIEERGLSYEVEVLEEGIEAYEEAGGSSVTQARAHIEAAEVVTSDDRDPAGAVRRAIEARPSDVQLTRLRYISSADAAGSLRITGTLPDQEVLADFARALRSESLFSTVEVPISSFANIREGGFSMTIRGAF